MLFMDIMTNLVDTLLQIALFQHVIQLCGKHRRLTILYFFVSFFALMTMNSLDIAGIYCTVIILCISTVYCLILTRQPWQSIFLPTVFSLLISLSEGITIAVIQWIFPSGTVGALMQTDSMLIGCMVFSRFILTIISLAVIRFVPIRFSVSRGTWFFLCLTSLYLFMLNMLVQSHLLGTIDFEHTFPLLLTGSVIICAAFFRLGQALSAQNLEKARLQDELQQNRLKLRQQDEMVSLYEQLHGIQHDYHNHLQILSSLAESGSQRDLLEYIRGLSPHIMPATTTVSTGNTYIDAILSAKCLIAQKNGVGLRLQIQIPDVLDIPPADICMLISNIMDNGLEACMNNQQAEHRMLSFYLAQQKGFLVLSSSNYTEKGTEAKRFSALHNTPSGGGGLRQIKRLTGQYDGYCEHSLSANKFRIHILLPHDVTYHEIHVFQRYPEEMT